LSSVNIVNKDENKHKILHKLESMNNKILNFFNFKLNLKLTRDEIKLELNNKNIDNMELNLLSRTNFNNLEEINLSHNNINNIECLKDFNFI